MLKCARRFVGVAILLIGSLSPAWAQAPWVVTDLGTLGGSTSSATGVNDAGQVVGTSQTRNGINHAYIWTPATGMVDLRTLGGSTSSASAVNATGQVVGNSNIATGQSHAFFWSAATGMIDLGTHGGATSTANAINSAGQVVGSSETATPGQAHAYIWSVATGMIDLGTLGGTSSAASDINDSGMVCGRSTMADGTNRAFRWTSAGGMADLGTLGGQDSVGLRINAAGWVTGSSFLTGGGFNVPSGVQFRAFLWKPGIGMSDLGFLGHSTGFIETNVRGFSDAGQVVGGIEHAFVISGDAAFSWTAATGTIRVASLGGAENTATAVNEGGLIVGSSFLAGDLILHPFAGKAGAAISDLGTLGGSTGSAAAVNNFDTVVGGAATPGGSSHAALWRRSTITAPVLQSNPSPQSVTAGTIAYFSAAASGSPAPAVQWQVSTNGGLSFTNIAGATSATYAFTAAANDDRKQFRAVFTNGSGSATSTAAALTVTPPVPVSVDRTTLRFAATNTGLSFTRQTPSQAIRILQSGGGAVSWTATPNQPWITVSPSTGSGTATLNVGVRFNNVLPVAGTTNGAIVIAFAGATNTAGPITVALTTVPNGTSTAPIGLFETPTQGATGVTGSIAVTGWAVDDIAVTGVRVLRDGVGAEGTALIFVGNAVLVDGARPDVAQAYPLLPLNTRAGWGYLLLTNFLPNLGNGTFTLHAIADDADGHSTELGTKTITCTNSSAVKPFGAIDTPGQGQTISGASFANFGWVLARSPALAYPPNGIVQVVIDGVFQPTPPMGWVSRSDLTLLFPSATYPGVGNALGVATLDTTALANGVHTLAWLVTADSGQADGIGSRFFTVANGAGLTLSSTASFDGAPQAGASEMAPALTVSTRADGAQVPRDAIDAAPLDAGSIVGRRGYDAASPYRAFAIGANGRVTMQGEELDRFELRLGDSGAGNMADRYSGYLRVDDALAPLPIGSHLDPATGVFTWQPGVGFLRAYDLVFVRWSVDQITARQEVRIVINPKGSNRVGPQVVIDAPAPAGRARLQAETQQPFVVAGWAIDADADFGTGVDTLHVWAYPATGGRPVFLGATAYGGRRPDVAAIFGERFRTSGYSLTVDSLPAGAYDIAVFAWSTATGGFVPAKVVRVMVR